MAARTWLKNLTALMIVAVIAGLVLLAVDRARKVVINPLLPSGIAEILPEVDDMYMGFKYTESVEGRLIFMLNSVRTLGLSSGWHEIEGVRLKLFNDDSEGPVLTSSKASFNKETRDARLSGGVHVAFPNGSFLDTEEGYFDARGRRFVTEGQVTFVSSVITGVAGKATYSFIKQKLDLQDGVVAQDRTGSSLRAPQLSYTRLHQRLVLDEGCEIAVNLGRMQAGKAIILLDQADGSIKRLTMTDGVTVHSNGDPLRGDFSGRTDRLEAVKDASGNWRIDSSGIDQRVTFNLVGTVDFYRREVSTWHLKAVIDAENLLNLQADTGVCLDEVPFVGSPRTAEAHSARVWFVDGRATDIELLNNVTMRAEGVVGKGHRARVSGHAGVVMLHGYPGGPSRAVVTSERGRFECDQLHLFSSDGRSEARGRVQGRITDAVLLAAEDQEKIDEPLHFAAEVLEISERGATYHLREGARAWQGRRLLLADEILYRQRVETLRAVGHVRTTFPASQMATSAAAGDDVVVVARSLDYGRAARQAIYRGSVHFSDSQHMMSAGELKVLFDDHDEITSVEAIGSIEIRDMNTGQRVTGQTARRIVDSDLVEVAGSPAQAIDEKGNVVRGNTLTWNQTSGSVTVAGNTETIYFPEEQP